MINREIDKLFPSGSIGVVGGGQLGRMFVFEAKRMGYHVVVLDPKPNSPAGQVADEQIVAGFDEIWAYRELARKTDIITFEFEHINVNLLATIEKEGCKVIPSSKTLEVIQNKYIQKSMLRKMGVKIPEFSKVNSLDDLKKEFECLSQQAILKSCTNGYDGKGNYMIKNEDDLEKAYQLLGEQEVFVEELIDFIMEVSIVVVKNNSGISFYPVAENEHHDSILIKSLIPASLPDEVINKIHAVSEKIIEEFDDFGIYCIEFFIDNDYEVLVNEIAPRPHNSGHYTIEGCITSQFEQLVRVICGMPIGSTKLRMPCAMYNILGNQGVDGEYEVSGLDALLTIPDCHFHLYGKPNTNYLKKIGHITVFGETVVAADDKARVALQSISITQK